MIKNITTFFRMHYYCAALFNHMVLLTVFKPDLSEQTLILQNLKNLVNKIYGFKKQEWR